MVLMRLLSLNKLQHVSEAAQYLLGCEIWRTLPSGEILKARIVETESYHQDDPASHTFRGKTERNKAMFGPPGHAYIYFTYGMHWCFNITAGIDGYGAGVLIRAVEPLQGLEYMKKFRSRNQKNKITLYNLTSGPAKLTAALSIDESFYGHDLSNPPLQVIDVSNKDFEIVATTRIGIKQAMNEIARFYIKDNPFVSRQ